MFNIGLYKAPGYDPLKDLAPVTVTGRSPTCWSSPPTNPATTVADLVAQARAKPGELTYGSSGVGSSLHMSGVMLEQRTGVRLQHVPYRGAPAAVLAVVNGEVTMGFFNTPTVMARSRPASSRRSPSPARTAPPLLPDVPTMIEAGVPDFVVATWLGYAVPASTPEPRSSRASMPRSTASAKSRRCREKLLVQGFEMLPPARRSRPQVDRGRPGALAAHHQGVRRQGRIGPPE